MQQKPADILIEYFEVVLAQSQTLLAQLSTLKSPNRSEIFNILYKKGERTISQVQKEVKLTYNNTFLNIKKLEGVGLVETKKYNKTKQGRPVVVYIKPSIKTHLLKRHLSTVKKKK